MWCSGHGTEHQVWSISTITVEGLWDSIPLEALLPPAAGHQDGLAGPLPPTGGGEQGQAVSSEQ